MRKKRLLGRQLLRHFRHERRGQLQVWRVVVGTQF
jgi:hypothetical protein